MSRNKTPECPGEGGSESGEGWREDLGSDLSSQGAAMGIFEA